MNPAEFFPGVFAEYERIYSRWTEDDFKKANNSCRKLAAGLQGTPEGHFFMFACIGIDSLRAIRHARASGGATPC